MKNVTITLPEEVARWAKVEAARRDRSLSRLIAEMLEVRMREHRAYGGAMRSYLGRDPVKLKSRGGYPVREEVHARRGVR